MKGRFLVIGVSWVLVFGAWANQSHSDLVDVQKFIPGIVLDIRYATTNNFMRQAVYPSAECYLRKSTATKLKAVQQEFAKMGLGIKIFDGYRPLSAQRKLWAIVPDERYVANPAKGSKHNRGGAVDITLIDRRTGEELFMPTGYDDFTEKAHRQCKDLPEQAIRHRELLRYVMQKHGFRGIDHEWWHFDDVDWRDYAILDINFDEMKHGENSRSLSK